MDNFYFWLSVSHSNSSSSLPPSRFMPIKYKSSRYISWTLCFIPRHILRWAVQRSRWWLAEVKFRTSFECLRTKVERRRSRKRQGWREKVNCLLQDQFLISTFCYSRFLALIYTMYWYHSAFCSQIWTDRNIPYIDLNGRSNLSTHQAMSTQVYL